MKQIILFLLWSCVAFAQGVKPAGASFPVHVKWEHAPTTINPKLEMGATTVLYFDDQKRFVVVGCVENQGATRLAMETGTSFP